ncbi:MAG: iron-sulfur cluster assembly accessory protein [Chitinophagales bacterium]|nr:iron-sulfur cluster assembly accessory protein [Chitinophagales bacterium]
MSTVIEQATEAPVKFSKTALLEFKRLYAERNDPANDGLRLGVKGGGCAGFSYIMGFDKQNELDQVFEVEGLKLYINKAHGIYLHGMEIDYRDGLDARGFVFNNPNAESTCGCGESFSA